MDKCNNHGGKREGAGRKASGKVGKSYYLTLSQEAMECLNAQGSDKSKYVERLIMEDINKKYMTRKDRIIEEALSYSGCSKEWFNDKGYCGESTSFDDAHSFVHGAEWADETMIDKVCHWLERNIRHYVTYDGEIELQELIDDFRKEIVE